MCEVILFPAQPVRRDWSEARTRVLAEGEWQRRMTGEYKARAPKPFRPLLLSAWCHHVARWRAEYPWQAPDDVPWQTLWTAFLIAHPDARKQPDGAA